MLKEETLRIIDEWKLKNKIKLYTPYKYFKGLDTKRKVISKLNDMNNFKNEKDVTKVEFQTDKGFKNTKKSPYHATFEKRFGISSASSFEQKSKATGVPVDIIQRVFKKGVAAWKSGHRPGTTSVQWGKARVDSFLVLGCAAFSGDANLLQELYDRRGSSKKLAAFFKQTPSCPKYKLDNYRKRSSFPSFI